MSTIVPQKLLGDCRQVLRTLPENYFHVCITSPHYYRLREYLPPGHPNKHLEIGNEERFEDYLDNLSEVFTQVRRVLRPDGTLWINLGDRYTNAGRSTYDTKSKIMGSEEEHPLAGKKRPADIAGLKKKELCMVPQRVAMVLQQHGWYLRSMIPWIKRNVMPESVKDRPVSGLEYFFMFSKEPDCYYDRFAVQVQSSENTHPRASVFPHRSVRDDNRRRRRINPKAALSVIGSKQNASFAEACSDYIPSKRYRRNTDWFMESWEGMLTNEEGDPLALVVNPRGTSIPHFASYPPQLVRPIIECSTSEKGCCPFCGAPMERQVKNGEPQLERQKAAGGDMFGGYNGQATKDFNANGVQNASDVKRRILAGMVEKITVGWKAQCECAPSPARPCRVLDPFHGVGSTCEAAIAPGRDYTGIELSEDYFKINSRDAQGALAVL